MASAPGPTSHRVAFLAALQQRPYAFGLFQTLRRLDCLYPEKPRLGESTKSAQDVVRLGQYPSLGFAPAELHSFDPGTEKYPPRLSVLSFGLFGPNGALPLHLTEWARDRLKRHDPTLCRFLDIFHHRMLSLFYRAWANAQPAVNLDRPDRDRFQIYVGAVFGFGMPSMRNRDEIPDFARLFFAGHLACQTRTPEGLEAILSTFLEMPVRLNEFIGQWLEMPVSDRWRLCVGSSVGRLGETTNLGSRVWDLQHKFRIVLGPITLLQYEGLLPGGGTFPSLAALIRSYVGYELEWDVNVILKKEEVPRMQLGTTSRLGWTSWLTGAVRERHAADPVLDPAVRAYQRASSLNDTMPVGN
jgi:type VI secretion system protein ImpH